MRRWMVLGLAACVVLAGLLGVGYAQAPRVIRIGVVVSATGPAAALGIPVRNAFLLYEELFRDAIPGYRIQYIILDDATNPTLAVQNARKLIAEDRVVLIAGSTVSVSALAMVDVTGEAGVPQMAMGATQNIVHPVDEKRRWVFLLPQTAASAIQAVTLDMRLRGIRTVGYIGFNDVWGEEWWTSLSAAAPNLGIRVVANERYARADTSVTGQVLRLLAARPDAVLVGASGTPAVLPQRTLRERGYRGIIYHTHAVGDPDVLRVGGKDLEGALLPVGPAVVAEQLPDNHPSKRPALEHKRIYESRYGPGTVSQFGAHVHDFWLIVRPALERALRRASLDNLPAFRAALRDEIEATRNLPGAHGVFTYSPIDHLGHRFEYSNVFVQVQGGRLKLLRTFLPRQ